MSSTQHNVVAHQLSTERRSAETHIENIASLLASISEAAQTMQTHDCQTGIDDAKTSFQSLLKAEAALAAHARAVQDMQLGYQPPESNIDETNFEELLQSATERHANTGFDPAESDQYKTFLEALEEGKEEGAGDVMDEDGDLQMERGEDVAPNRVCPLSMIEVMLLEDPVEDSKGFVYQRSSIESYIRAKPGGVTIAPNAGATHSVRVADLKPARKVIRAQKRRAKTQLTQTQAPNTDDVLDAD